MARTNWVQKYVKILSEHGKRIVNEQLASVEYAHRTYNLHDSYGWGVYVDGKLVASGFPEEQAKEGKEWKGDTYKGRKTITDFLNNKYKPHPGIDFVVAVAMPYGIEVEVVYGYEVIASARRSVMDLAPRFKNATSGIIGDGSY